MSTQVLQTDTSVGPNGFDAVLVETADIDGVCIVDGASSSDAGVNVVGLTIGGAEGMHDNIKAGDQLYVLVKNHTASTVALSVRVALTKVDALPPE